MPIIDGTDMVLGRLATEVIKLAKQGKQVEIVNAKDVVVTGDKQTVFKKYKHMRDLTCNVNPRRGIKFPRTPERIVKRTIRGMLPHKEARGKHILKIIKVHRSVPERLTQSKKIQIESAKNKSDRFVKIADISKFLGYNKL